MSDPIVVELVRVKKLFGTSVWSVSDVKDVLAVSAWVCCDEDTVLNEVLTVDWEAGRTLNERAISSDGFLNNDGWGFGDARTWGLMKGCVSFEIFVNFEDFPFSCEPSEGLFRTVLCNERWLLASTLLLADFDVTDGDGDLDVALGDGGVTKSSSSSSVGDPGSRMSTCKAPALSCP
jgi:hypothetical protein